MLPRAPPGAASALGWAPGTSLILHSVFFALTSRPALLSTPLWATASSLRTANKRSRGAFSRAPKPCLSQRKERSALGATIHTDSVSIRAPSRGDQGHRKDKSGVSFHPRPRTGANRQIVALPQRPDATVQSTPTNRSEGAPGMMVPR